jgi:hypothetical protein
MGKEQAPISLGVPVSIRLTLSHAHLSTVSLHLLDVIHHYCNSQGGTYGLEWYYLAITIETHNDED